MGVVGEFEYYHCWGLASVHLRTFLSLSVEYWSISRSFPVEEREKVGFKDVSHSNQRRFKDVHERVCTEVNRSLIYDYLVIPLGVHPFSI